mmetsp:Transcript_22780/g.58382  ORF Transcript_22780/g.58382 Transcript_22780/m.58382 type:complete len:213 (-) Transcript_22780:626-1264(-)
MVPRQPGCERLVRDQRNLDAAAGIGAVLQGRLGAVPGERVEPAGRCGDCDVHGLERLSPGTRVYGARRVRVHVPPGLGPGLGAVCLHDLLVGGVQHSESGLAVRAHRAHDHQHRERHQVPHLPAGFPMPGQHLQLPRCVAAQHGDPSCAPHAVARPLEHDAARVRHAAGQHRPGGFRDGGVRRLLPDHVSGLCVHADRPAAEPGHRDDGGEL